MKKINWNRLSVLYPKDIKEEREKVLSWCEVAAGSLPEKAADGQSGPGFPAHSPASGTGSCRAALCCPGISGAMQKPRPAPRFLQQERGEEKMKKSN